VPRIITRAISNCRACDFHYSFGMADHCIELEKQKFLNPKIEANIDVAKWDAQFPAICPLELYNGQKITS
jgi:hypothetical protein